VRLEAADPAGASYQARVVARGQADARNGYTARVAHTPAGAVSWAVHRVVGAGGAGTVALGSGTLASTGGAGSTWWIRLKVQGTTVQARFWRDGTAEPATWRITATDTQWASGTVGVGAFAGAGLTAPFPSAAFRRFEAVDLAA
jgi:hypothetical protein